MNFLILRDQYIAIKEIQDTVVMVDGVVVKVIYKDDKPIFKFYIKGCHVYRQRGLNFILQLHKCKYKRDREKVKIHQEEVVRIMCNWKCNVK